MHFREGGTGPVLSDGPHPKTTHKAYPPPSFRFSPPLEDKDHRGESFSGANGQTNMFSSTFKTQETVAAYVAGFRTF